MLFCLKQEYPKHIERCVLFAKHVFMAVSIDCILYCKHCKQPQDILCLRLRQNKMYDNFN